MNKLSPPPALPAAPFLGVERSRAQRRWVQRPLDQRQAEAICQRLGVPEVVGRVMAGRGVGVEQAEAFLAPTLRDLLPDPSHLLDMDAAVSRLAEAAERRETVAIFGDYDVDGATSTALLKRFLVGLGVPVLVHIPDRVTEGYGPNVTAMRDLAARGASVCVTVDCGISAFAPLAEAKAVGMDVIVCDHHEARTELPAAVAVINPKRLDETSPHTYLAAVGVTFLLCVGLARALRERGWKAVPDLMALLDLVALGTVCDMVPLTGVNRAFVIQGLKMMARRGNVGLTALVDGAGISEAVDAFHLGYMLGPRVNAGGRVGRAGLGADLLCCDNPEQAAAWARELDEFNATRKDLEAAVLLEAIEQVETQASGAVPLVFAVGQHWHPGVVGIVASRLKERYGLPSCAVAVEGGIAKGSGRSVPGIDLGRAIIAAREAGLLDAGGGHAMAAGFTVSEDKLDAFREFLSERLSMQAEGGDLTPLLELDGVLDVNGANGDLVRALAQAGPYGSGNPEPRFAIANAKVGRADIVGMGHVRCFLSGPAGGRLKAIAFKAADDDVGLALLNAQGASLHVAGTLRADTWQGRDGVQFVIDDVA